MTYAISDEVGLTQKNTFPKSSPLFYEKFNLIKELMFQSYTEATEDTQLTNKPTKENLDQAISFLEQLPLIMLEIPEVSIDSDGYIALTWENDHYDSVIVLCSEEEIIWTSIFKSGYKTSGNYPSLALIPKILKNHLLDISANE